MSVEFPEANDEIKAILRNPDIQKMIDDVEALLLDDRDLTPDQWKYYQQRINGKIDVLTDDIKKTTKDIAQINPYDSTEVKAQKVRLHKHLLSFLEKAFNKLKETFKRIFDQIKNGIKWCWGKLKETFSSFKRLFY